MKGQAVGRYVLLSDKQGESKTESGLLLTNSNSRFKRGIVVSGGDTEGLKKGDEVIYDSSTSHEQIIDKKKYTITKIDTIAIIL